MFEGDSADTCTGKFPLMSMEGRAEGLACADPEARTPIGVSGNFQFGSDSSLAYKCLKFWQISGKRFDFLLETMKSASQKMF
jgi:hypothetical protein